MCEIAFVFSEEKSTEDADFLEQSCEN